MADGETYWTPDCVQMSNLRHAARSVGQYAPAALVTRDSFLVAVCVPARLHDAGDPDRFFASAYDNVLASTTRVSTEEYDDEFPGDERPAIFVFATRDESVAGRCASVQTIGGCVALTIVDSRLTQFGIPRTISELSHALARYDTLFTQVMRHTLYNGSRYGGQLLDVVKDAGEMALEKLVNRTRSTVEAHWYPRHRNDSDEDDSDNDSDESDEEGNAPNLTRLLCSGVGGLGAIEAIAAEDLPAGAMAASTFANGDAAMVVIHKPCPGVSFDYATRVAERVSGLACRVLIAIELQHREQAHTYKWRDRLSSYTLFRDHAEPIVCISACGVSVAHATHVAEIVYRCALRGRHGDHHERRDIARISNVLERACTSAEELDIAGLREARAMAVATIKRTVSANLGSIKARLWRPDGRLATRMVDTDMAHDA